MKLLRYSESKTFHYDNAEERLNHISGMKQEGWENSGKVKGFIGNLCTNDVEDDSKYYYIGEFYKENNIKEKVKDCLSCGYSMSIPEYETHDGFAQLYCTIAQIEVSEEGYCKNYN